MHPIGWLIDAMTLGSDRPLRRLLAYYAILAAVLFTVSYFFPDTQRLLLGKGVGASPDGPLVLQDGLSSVASSVPGFGPGSLGELTITTTIILIGTLLLMLPVTWVYMSVRSSTGHSQPVVQTLLILPLVVAGVIIVVQNSLALAFSLAGVVAAVRFRTTLRDPRDAVYIFLGIGVGFAAGVQALAVGAVLSIVFNLVLLLTWRYDYGRNVLTPSAASQWAGPLNSLMNATGEGKVPDRDLVLSLTPESADALANKFERVSEVLGKKKKKPRYSAVVTITTDDVAPAQAATEEVLGKMTRRWRLDEVVTNVGKPSEIYYLVRLRKSVDRDEVLTAIHNAAGGLIATANLELGERLSQPDVTKA